MANCFGETTHPVKEMKVRPEEMADPVKEMEVKHEAMAAPVKEMKVRPEAMADPTEAMADLPKEMTHRFKEMTYPFKEIAYWYREMPFQMGLFNKSVPNKENYRKIKEEYLQKNSTSYHLKRFEESFDINSILLLVPIIDK